MKAFLFAIISLALFSLVACSNPGKECCDCLIEKSCWGADDYACYYYYDEGYGGEDEDPPPAQTWSKECQEEHCEICKEADENFQD